MLLLHLLLRSEKEKMQLQVELEGLKQTWEDSKTAKV